MTGRILSFFALFAALTLTATGAWSFQDTPEEARAQGAHQGGEAHVEVTLVADVTEVRPGDTFRVGVFFELAQDWHIYWENPGDSGLPTRINWESEGAEFGPLQWSAPGLYPEAGGELITFGYDGEVVLYSYAQVDDEVGDSITINAEVEYLACHGACLPGEHGLELTLPVGEQRQAAPASVLKLFDDYSMQVPQDAEAVGIDVRASHDTDNRAMLEVILCQGPGDDCPQMEIAFEELNYALVTTAKSDFDVEILSVAPHPEVYRGWVLSLRLLSGADDDEAQLSGIVRLDDTQGSVIPVHISAGFDEASERLDTLYEDPEGDALAVDASGGDAPDDRGGPGLLYILVLAFLGGMILNLMPCVFPVLAIKVTSFTEMAHQERSGVIAHGAAYTAGITGSLLLLGAVVAGLRLAGTQVGWGFQFQQPLFLGALAVIIVLFALNTFGLFQVTLNPNAMAKAANQTTGLRRSAAEGVLAVTLATPCSAPFLGTAMGFALTAHPLVILLVFFVLGLGLAAPFVVLTLIPGAAKILPRPGAWMAHLKSFLGFALLGAAIWLVWLVGRLAGVDAMARLLALLGTISMSVWIFGIVQFRSWTRGKVAAIATAALILAAGLTLALPLEGDGPQGDSAGSEIAAGQGPIEWRSWSHDAVAEELAAGRSVFVNFTADWCLTCKANERTAINTERVEQAVAAGDVAMLKADWTRPDETIRAEIAAHGRGGVPMYLFYTPDAPDSPEVLPEVLTPAMLVDRFN